MKTKRKIPSELRRTSPRGQKPVFESSVSEESRKAWSEVLKKIHVAKEALDVRSNEDWWYRGQSSDRSLVPSLFRLLDKGFNEKDSDPRSIYELEYNLFFEFACRGPGMQETGLSGWDKLNTMQHHGLPTRLLDWSQYFGIALFFALGSERKVAGALPAIWILSPYRLNELVMGDRDLYSPTYLGYDWDSDEKWDYEDFLIFEGGTFDWDGPVAIYPEQKNVRMRSQMGWFTIFGEDTKPLDKQFDSKDLSGLLEKVEIPLSAVPAAKEFLIEAGINHETVYRDLDGFARNLKYHYNLL